MYQFKPVTDRIERMRARVRDRLIVADPVKARLAMEAKIKYSNYPPVIQKAMEEYYIISKMPIDIVEDEYFAGDVGNKGWGSASGTMWLMMDIENTWPIGEDGLHHAPDDDPMYSHQKLAISPADLKELRELMKQQFSANKESPKHIILVTNFVFSLFSKLKNV